MDEPSPTAKLMRSLAVAALLSIGIFITWLLVSDRQSQSTQARSSIAEGWGGTQVISGPELSIPFKVTTPGATDGNGRTITGPVVTEKRLILAPLGVDLATRIAPERRARSIYEVVVYRADTRGRATFALPADLSRLGIPAGALELNRAELRFGVADPRGLSANPVGGSAIMSFRSAPAAGPAWCPPASTRRSTSPSSTRPDFPSICALPCAAMRASPLHPAPATPRGS
jgi:inner membrane protein